MIGPRTTVAERSEAAARRRKDHASSLVIGPRTKVAGTQRGSNRSSGDRSERSRRCRSEPRSGPPAAGGRARHSVVTLRPRRPARRPRRMRRDAFADLLGLRSLPVPRSRDSPICWGYQRRDLRHYPNRSAKAPFRDGTRAHNPSRSAFPNPQAASQSQLSCDALQHDPRPQPDLPAEPAHHPVVQVT